MRIDGKTVALVTGATGGLGQAIARGLHRRGAQVILTGRRRQVLDELATDLGARAIAADLTLPEDVARLADEAGVVDVLVLNAALPASGALMEFTDGEIDRALAANLRAPASWPDALANVWRLVGEVRSFSSRRSKANPRRRLSALLRNQVCTAWLFPRTARGAARPPRWRYDHFPWVHSRRGDVR